MLYKISLFSVFTKFVPEFAVRRGSEVELSGRIDSGVKELYVIQCALSASFLVYLRLQNNAMTL